MRNSTIAALAATVLVLGAAPAFAQDPSTATAPAVTTTVDDDDNGFDMGWLGLLGLAGLLGLRRKSEVHSSATPDRRPL